MVIGKGYTDRFLSDDEIRELVFEGFAQADVSGKRVLVIIPDGTRTAPNGQLFRLFHEAIGGKAAKLDYLVALGTHIAMSDDALNRLVGITAEERATKYAGTRIFNHAWDDPAALVRLGTITADEIDTLTGGLFRQEVPVTVNRLVLDYDLLVICGPTFPHEVVGFSGGNKYFFPGISGAEVINFTHWLGAVMTNYVIIGTKHTPVRAVINRAAAMIDRPKLCFSMVVAPAKGEVAKMAVPPLNGLYVGTPEEAWEGASDLSSQVHVVWVEKPYKRVLSVMPHLYDDIWTGAKGDVQDGAGHRRRRRGDHLRAAHHRDLLHPRPHLGPDRLPLSGLLPQAVGQVQGYPRRRAGALDPRARPGHVRSGDRRREVPHPGHAGDRHHARAL